MSKKIIKTATAQVEMYGYFAGVALFNEDKERQEKYRSKFDEILNALELLEVMTWDDLTTKFEPIYFQSRRNAYENCKAIAV